MMITPWRDTHTYEHLRFPLDRSNFETVTPDTESLLSFRLRPHTLVPSKFLLTLAKKSRAGKTKEAWTQSKFMVLEEKHEPLFNFMLRRNSILLRGNS